MLLAIFTILVILALTRFTRGFLQTIAVLGRAGHRHRGRSVRQRRFGGKVAEFGCQGRQLGRVHRPLPLRRPEVRASCRSC